MPEKVTFPLVDATVVGAKHHELEDMLSKMAQGVNPAGSAVKSPGGLVGLTSRPPTSVGIGTWEFIQLSPNLILSVTDVDYTRAHQVDIEGDDTFKVRVVLRGRIRSSSQSDVLSAPFVYVEAYPGHAVSSYEVLPGKLEMLVLHCRMRELVEGLGLVDFPMPRPISHLFDNKAATAPMGDAVRIGAEVMRAASDIQAAMHQYPPALLPAVLLAKSREILCSVLRQLSSPSVDAAAHGLRSRDVNRIYEARDIVLANLESPPPLADLARTVGVCQTKLKSGFKAIFGATVFEFVRARQMERAMDLILSTDKTISQISYEVGYQYPANFTHAFKKHYDLLPTDARRPEHVSDDVASI